MVFICIYIWLGIERVEGGRGWRVLRMEGGGGGWAGGGIGVESLKVDGEGGGV